MDYYRYYYSLKRDFVSALRTDVNDSSIRFRYFHRRGRRWSLIFGGLPFLLLGHNSS